MMVTVPVWLRMFYPSLEWRVKGDSKNIYITFDDGPPNPPTGASLTQSQREGTRA